MRLFVGIPISDQVRLSLERLLAHLRPAGHVKWSPPYNLHITTKFIGEWPNERLDELKQVLATVKGPGPIEIHVNGLGWFPNPHHPKTFWAAVRAGDLLKRLAQETEEALTGIGIAKEDREYTPHLTLARIRDASPLGTLKKAVADLESVDFGSFTANEFHLYLSEPGPAGSIYTSLAHFPLNPA